jgi:glycosyltransferase involved in cell wall biosynthesis
VINLLYDSTSIIEGFKTKHVSRSGIYWVTYNILWQFIFCKVYNITLLIPPCSFINKIYIKKIFNFKFKYITFYNKSKCRLNISQLKNKILKSKNIIKIFYYILKININFIYIFLSYGFEKKIKHIDVFFSPMYTVPDEIKKNTSIKSFQILYDCIPTIFRDLYPFIDTSHWYLNLIENLNKETTYFCISQCTKKDFLKYFSERLDINKVFVTHIASAREFIQQYNREIFNKIFKIYKIKLAHNVNYIFSLCTLEPRKNLLFTVKCFIDFIKKNNIDNLYFFLCGGYFPGFIEQFKQKLSEYSEYLDKIIMIGYINDEDVNILYSNSLFFVYLSQYEGFGMPPLEAMQAGTPVICSNNSSLPEVVGDAAITVDYDSEEQCINAFEKFYFNSELRKEYIDKGLERSKLFSWEKTFDIMSNKIIEAVNNQQPHPKGMGY